MLVNMLYAVILVYLDPQLFSHTICYGRGSNLPNDSIFPNTELGPVNGVKSKKKRKESSKEGRILEADNGNHIKAIEENKSQQANTEADNMDHDLLERSECDQRPTNNM